VRRFELSDGTDFEIPDGWWSDAGMTDFKPTGIAYRSGPHQAHTDYEVMIVPIAEIKPIHRSPGVTLDHAGFNRDRMTKILRGLRDGDQIEPVQVSTLDAGPYKFQIYDGFHRFHASVAVGFTALPVIIGKWGFFSVD